MKKKHFYLLLTAFSIFFTVIFFTEKKDRAQFPHNINLGPELAKKIPTLEQNEKKGERVPASSPKDLLNDLEKAQKHGPAIPLKDRKILENSFQVYQEQKNYHYTTLPLDPKEKRDPLLSAYEIKPEWMPSLLGDNLRARLHALKPIYRDEEEAIFALEVENKGKKISDAELEFELTDMKGEIIQKILFNSKKESTYFAHLPLKNISDGQYMLKGRVALEGEEVGLTEVFSKENVAPLFLSLSPARLSENKDLTFFAKYNIPEGGNYLVEATFYNDSQLPIASFEKVLRLGEGEQDILLSLDGYYLFSKKMGGKISVGSLTLGQVKEDLTTIRGDLIRPEVSTTSFTYESFRSVPIVNEILDDKSKSIASALQH